ncbi:ATP-binding domain-containing protein [Streptomyces sp. NBC_00053]|uniref:helix-hairpin-helix domain-containing protein n=1 Tax=unclassified Streptomyces TaxID=2593676 RepID=UPI002251E684|nr:MULTISPECIES: helix-hairpin-helix domain-containing protein [unclassified Streptomyces]WSX00517.1 ATP-binding domain-containing protein [Streptomyces sp. NBC_00987]MCX5159169.1 ATP-binding domain-containing protein [Streptomyces sp. NBC_00305]MCX5217692.1 ATP-binding domain-containing protein [Streptomyces sp. NBC_00264]MCX5499485.1 ATP-binding domain-containing protein [Streptomyces sp. NBC_00052]MCX5551980.1 ATP-binding domain-containing protein [Streptomyces sp. NBC_00051]
MTALPRGETPGSPAADDDVAPPSSAVPAPSTGDGPETDGGAPGAGERAEATDDTADGETDSAGEATDGETGDAADDTGGADDTADAAKGSGTGADADAAPAPLSEAEAELAAQRELRERIERRKAEKEGPIAAGGKLSGKAADLLAAVRAVESGEQPATSFFDSPAPAAPRRTAPQPAPARPRVPEPARAPRSAPPEAVAAAAAVLAEGGAPAALAGPAAETLGAQAADALRTDPWQLLGVPGVKPEQADGFARALLGAECGPDDERRTAALVGWLLERAALRGHTALDASEVRAALAERSVADPEAAVQHAVAEGVVLVFQDGQEDEQVHDGQGSGAPAESDGDEGGDEGAGAGQEPVQVLLGLDRYALAEESLADGLARLVNACEKDADWEQAASAAGSPSAAELIRAVAAHGLVAHTGGEAARAEPAALITAARTLGLRALGVTHSADGRRRLAGATGDPETAVTLAGLLSGEQGPGRDGEGAIAVDLLVVLDAPQLDVETAAILVESLADGTRLVLSGDPGVLGSAGAGRVFADVLAARACPQIVSRTPDPGPIGELVSGIGVGELNQVEAPGKEVVIIPVRDAGEAVHRTVQLVADSVPRAIGVPSSDTQVITVGHGGSAGTRALNAALKQRLNPGPGRFGGFDPGDRVVHVPAPGRAEPAVVVSADAEGLHLDCAGTEVVVAQERVESSVRHGWALSAHQAAGMRWPAVVVVLPGDAAQGLSRSWVYTAFSRGERHLSVVHGVDQALPRAVAQPPAQDRTTRLRTLLETPAG